jgi:ABC-2 type transport system permease protein
MDHISASLASTTNPASANGPQPRQLGAVNWLGLWTLFVKEVRRFLKVYFQTVLAPVVTTLLFLAIFALATGQPHALVGGVPYGEFLAPGLIMMAITQNAFANTSSSLIIAKVQGNIVDLLMPPLSPLEQTVAVALGGVARGLLVGAAVLLAMLFIVPLHVASLPLILFHALAASLLLSFLGMAGGIWAEKFDHLASVTNFIITPLSFLSGTFYSVERLPDLVRTLAKIDPFFYMIDGFRAGFIGHSDGDIATGLIVMTGCNLVLGFVSYRMFKSGYKLKA